VSASQKYSSACDARSSSVGPNPMGTAERVSSQRDAKRCLRHASAQGSCTDTLAMGWACRTTGHPCSGVPATPNGVAVQAGAVSILGARAMQPKPIAKTLSPKPLTGVLSRTTLPFCVFSVDSGSTRDSEKVCSSAQSNARLTLAPSPWPQGPKSCTLGQDQEVRSRLRAADACRSPGTLNPV